MKNQANILKITLIAGGILLSIGMFLVVGALILLSLKPQPPQPSREAVLATFMPKPAAETKLVKQGYDPKASCFDKCGYLYRTYSYSSQETICRNLFEALKTVGHKSSIVDGSDRDTTEAQCANKVAQYVQKTSATNSIHYDVRARLESKDGKYHYANESIVVTAVVSLAQKTVEYRVSQLNENMKFVY